MYCFLSLHSISYCREHFNFEQTPRTKSPPFFGVTMPEHQLPPSKRGLANIKEDLMLDLSREIEKMTAYDEKLHPDGLIDLTSSLNELMLPDLQDYFRTNINVDFNKGTYYDHWCLW